MTIHKQTSDFKAGVTTGCAGLWDVVVVEKCGACANESDKQTRSSSALDLEDLRREKKRVEACRRQSQDGDTVKVAYFDCLCTFFFKVDVCVYFCFMSNRTQVRVYRKTLATLQRRAFNCFAYTQYVHSCNSFKF